MTLAWEPSLRRAAEAQASRFLRGGPGWPVAERTIVAIVLDTAQCEFGIGLSELVSRRRAQHLIDARAFVVWALRTLGPPLSYPAIACALGERNHSTAINLHQKAVALRLRDPAFAGACQRLAERFSHWRTAP